MKASELYDIVQDFKVKNKVSVNTFTSLGKSFPDINDYIKECDYDDLMYELRQSAELTNTHYFIYTMLPYHIICSLLKDGYKVYVELRKSEYLTFKRNQNVLLVNSPRVITCISWCNEIEDKYYTRWEKQYEDYINYKKGGLFEKIVLGNKLRENGNCIMFRFVQIYDDVLSIAYPPYMPIRIINQMLEQFETYVKEGKNVYYIKRNV